MPVLGMPPADGDDRMETRSMNTSFHPFLTRNRCLRWPVMACMVLMALAWTRPVFAQSAVTLVDLYRMALERAEQIAISRESVAIAEDNETRALAVLHPRANAVGNYRRYSEDQTLMGTVIQPEWSSAYGVTVGQQFTLNGRELTALRIAREDIRRRQHDLDAVKEAYLFRVADAFFQVARARKAVDIAVANVTRLTTHRDAVLQKLQLSEVTKTELYRTEAELAQAEAEQIQADNALQLARAGLARLVDLQPGFTIDEQVAQPHGDDALPLDTLKKNALNDRPEMKSLAVQAQIAEDEVTYARGAYWPTVGLEGAWMRMDQRPESVYDESIYVGATLDFRFYDGGLRKAEVSQARSRMRQASLQRSDTARQIEVEVENAWRELQSRKSVITALTSQLAYAKQNYAAVSRLFEHGLANSVDVMDANTLLVTGERRLTGARYDLRVARLNLKRAVGGFLTDVDALLAEASTSPSSGGARSRAPITRSKEMESHP